MESTHIDLATPENLNIERGCEPKPALYEAVPGKDLRFAVFAPREGSGLPVVLFQHGHQVDAAGHAFMAQRIANAGYLVVMPERANSVSYGCCGTTCALCCFCTAPGSRITDGKHLLAAHAWVEEEAAEGSSPLARGDLRKVAVMGHSMGGVEAVNFTGMAAPGEFQACVFVSPALPTYFSITTRTWHPLNRRRVKALSVPSLWVTSEGDIMKAATYTMSELAGGGARLVTLKDSALDLSMPLTKATSWWYPFTLPCLGNRVLGVSQHTALAAEAFGEPHRPVIAFLDSVFLGKEFVVDESIMAPKRWPCCLETCAVGAC